MAQVSVTINGKTFRMACDDGQEQHLIDLGDRLNGTIDELRGAFGEIGDQRLTVMAAITTMDRVVELERRVAALEAERASADGHASASAGRQAETEAALAARLVAAAETIERLSDTMNGSLRTSAAGPETE